jgi:hypothetical protein
MPHLFHKALHFSNTLSTQEYFTQKKHSSKPSKKAAFYPIRNKYCFFHLIDNNRHCRFRFLHSTMEKSPMLKNYAQRLFFILLCAATILPQNVCALFGSCFKISSAHDRSVCASNIGSGNMQIDYVCVTHNYYGTGDSKKTVEMRDGSTQTDNEPEQWITPRKKHSTFPWFPFSIFKRRPSPRVCPDEKPLISSRPSSGSLSTALETSSDLATDGETESVLNLSAISDLDVSEAETDSVTPLSPREWRKSQKRPRSTARRSLAAALAQHAVPGMVCDDSIAARKALVKEYLSEIGQLETSNAATILEKLSHQAACSASQYAEFDRTAIQSARTLLSLAGVTAKDIKAQLHQSYSAHALTLA